MYEALIKRALRPPMCRGHHRAAGFLVLMTLLSLIVIVPPATADATSPRPFASLGELELSLAALTDKTGADALWARVKAAGTMPLVFGRTAVFLYRGDAQTVEWRGDFSSWGPSWDTRGTRIGNTDIWRKSLQLLPGSRLDYKIVVDGETWMLDPLNPHEQAGGSGSNSEARMPDWQPSPLAERRPDVPRGKLSPYQIVESRHLGYPVKYRVYTPFAIAGDLTGLPSIYVTDGPDYYRDNWGAMLTVMDNLRAENKIEPVIAVFINQWNLDDTENRRGSELVPDGPGDCDFCQFIVDELVPVIEAAYPVSDAGEDRAILGTSLGGLYSTYMGLWHGDDFGRVAIQSPAYQYEPGRFIFEALLKTREFPRQVFLNVGLYERDFVGRTRRVAEHLRELDVDLLYLEVPDGHSWGQWRSVLDDALLFFYGTDPARAL